MLNMRKEHGLLGAAIGYAMTVAGVTWAFGPLALAVSGAVLCGYLLFGPIVKG